MTPEEQIKVKELFLLVVKLPKEQQIEYLKKACVNCPSLLPEVEKLLSEEVTTLILDEVIETVEPATKIVSEKRETLDFFATLHNEHSARNITLIANQNFNANPSQNQSFDNSLLVNSKVASIKSSSQEPLLNGLIVNNRYQIEGKFGEGGFSIVYLAKDLNLNSRNVLIKVLQRQMEGNWPETKFFQEIKALAKINHPNVVSIFDYGILHNGNPFFVIELIPGETLRSLISKAKTGIGLTPQQAINVIKQLSNALSTVHELRIYHRDLKPENIIVRKLNDEEEHVKVIDFGIATVKESIGALTLTNSVIGTPTYMAPEQFDGNPSASSDIYALGIIAYEMLTGKLPFDISNYKKFKDIITNLRKMQQQCLMAKPSSLNQSLSTEVDKVLFKVLSFNPQDRYSKTGDFAKALSKALTLSLKPSNFVWKKLCSLARSTSRIWFIDDELIRNKIKTSGISALYGKTLTTCKSKNSLSIVLDLDAVGYLFLIVRDVDDQIICLCPSQFAANDKLNGCPLLLPTEGLIYQSLPINQNIGRKELIGIVSKAPLNLNLPSANFQSPAQILSISDINVIISKLEQMPSQSWQAFYSYVDIH